MVRKITLFILLLIPISGYAQQTENFWDRTEVTPGAETQVYGVEDPAGTNDGPIPFTMDAIQDGASYEKIATGSARMDSEYTSTNLTVDANPEQITPAAVLWEEKFVLSGTTADGYEIELLETDAFAGKRIVLYNDDTAEIYHVDDASGNVENPNDKTVYLAPKSRASWVYDGLAWIHEAGGSYDLVISHRDFGSALTADGTYSGNTITMTVDSGQSNTLFGQAYHIDTDGELIEADADVATSGAAPAVCLAITAGTGASKLCLIQGQICETAWNWTIGGKVYLGDAPATTTGLTQTAPATTGDQVQPVGIALSADTIFFSPTLDTVEVP